MTYTLNVAVTAMNILDGIEATKHWDELQPVWEHHGKGFVEFCQWLAEFAVESEDRLREYAPQDFPGVYDYEVSCSLGVWIRKRMLEDDQLPSDGAVSHMLQVFMDSFFKQDYDTYPDTDSDQLPVCPKCGGLTEFDSFKTWQRHTCLGCGYTFILEEAT